MDPDLAGGRLGSLDLLEREDVGGGAVPALDDGLHGPWLLGVYTVSLLHRKPSATL